MTTERFYVDEDGYGEPCVWYGTGPESRDDKLVLRKHNLDREGVELWPMVSAALLAYGTESDDVTAAAAQQREERAVAEARPHDDEDLRADRHAEITEAERSEEVHGG
ncbi:hypothetical protein [Amycolatopsis sp. cmx-4-83]|uniref:hypothetical protein n=1 Tax=Amycolatopsis sp. cmx-4-83 TaxID=2790940 RepID=UPI00397E6CC8